MDHIYFENLSSKTAILHVHEPFKGVCCPVMIVIRNSSSLTTEMCTHLWQWLADRKLNRVSLCDVNVKRYYLLQVRGDSHRVKSPSV